MTHASIFVLAGIYAVGLLTCAPAFSQASSHRTLAKRMLLLLACAAWPLTLLMSSTALFLVWLLDGPDGIKRIRDEVKEDR